jgi:recombination protein RecA
VTPKKQTRSSADDLIDQAIAEIAQENAADYGKEVIQRAGDLARRKMEVLPTGVLSIDMALGCGGVPKGRIMEVYGPAGEGKTTLLLNSIAEAQRTGRKAAYVDAEHKLDFGWAEKLGVNLEDLVLVKPYHGEQAIEIMLKLTESALDMIIVDSVAALVPRAELDGAVGDANMGLQARMIGQAMRMLNGTASRSGTALLFINQVRSKIGGYGNPLVTSAGKALEFYASIRLEIRKGDPSLIKEGDKIVGIRSKIVVRKNQVAAPFEETEFDIYSGKCGCHRPGIDKEADLLDTALRAGVVEKSGAWFNYAGERLGQGRTAAALFLAENPQVAETIKFAILKPKSTQGEQAK